MQITRRCCSDPKESFQVASVLLLGSGDPLSVSLPVVVEGMLGAEEGVVLPLRARALVARQLSSW